MAEAKDKDRPRGEADPKAAPKPVKPSPQRAAADLTPKLAQEIERLRGEAPTPEGVQAAPGDFARKLKLALPHILTGLIELGTIAADGRLDAAEVRDLAGKLFTFVQGLRSGAG